MGSIINKCNVTVEAMRVEAKLFGTSTVTAQFLMQKEIIKQKNFLMERSHID